ncbi:MAG: potassium channel protein [Saprospiraceae bacterium]
MRRSRFRRFYNPLASYSLTRRFLDYRVGLGLFALSIAGGTLGYILIEGYSVSDAFYMAIITMSTVGYMEVHHLSEAGRMFTAGYILINIGIFAYALSAFTNYIVQGEIFVKMHNNLIHGDLERLQDHIIVCGYGRYGREIAHHFMSHQQTFVIVDASKAVIEEIQASPARQLYLEGDATQDDVLIKAGIHRASTLVAALSDDSDNVFTVLTARQLNPNIKIVSRSFNPKSAHKLRLAGADHVIMPEQIGGFYMATLVTKPGTVEFFTFLTNEYDSDVTFEELSYDNMPESCRDQSIKQLQIHERTGVNIIGFRNQRGKFSVNPSSNTVLTQGTSFIVIGSHQQIDNLKEHLRRLGR